MNTAQWLGRKVIVRTFSAGVHYGTLAEWDGKLVALNDSRRIWFWKERFTLSEIAARGVGQGSKLSEAVPVIALTEAIEIIPVSDEGIANLEGFPAWKV